MPLTTHLFLLGLPLVFLAVPIVVYVLGSGGRGA
jgi:hypothetical protein